MQLGPALPFQSRASRFAKPDHRRGRAVVVADGATNTRQGKLNEHQLTMLFQQLLGRQHSAVPARIARRKRDPSGRRVAKAFEARLSACIFFT